MKVPQLRAVGVTKRFPGVMALDDVTLELEAGQVHTVLGENGAGKTTLMNIIYGLCRPDSGHVEYEGRPVVISSPKAAIGLGIAMVHQDFMLIPALTVAENVVLGLPSGRGPLSNLEEAQKRIGKLSEEYGLGVDPRAKIWQLPMGARQRVEIIKALYREAGVLILDEPTSVLTPVEVQQLFVTLRHLADEGRTIVLITHKLEEALQISDRITVLRRGRLIETLLPAEASPALLARLVVGRDVALTMGLAPIMNEDRALELRNLKVRDDRELLAVRGISFSVCCGEILGIVGIDGNGQRELAEAITGVRPPVEGSIFLLGQETTRLSPGDLIKMGLGYIPEDRTAAGLVTEFTISENLILDRCFLPPFCKGWLLNSKVIREHCCRLLQDFDIRAPSPYSVVRTLSGGNQQKVVLARILSRKPTVLVAFQPTRGLDVGATEEVHRALLEHRQRGGAILLISMELDEALSLCDRIAVLFRGELMGMAHRGAMNSERIGLLMTGVKAIS